MSKQLHQRPRSEASLSNEWETPMELVKQFEQEYNLKFGLDVCATFENAKCQIYLGDWQENGSALTTDWDRGIKSKLGKHISTMTSIDTIYIKYDCARYINPPNSLTQLFIEKADEQWRKKNFDILMLIPINATVTKNGKKYIWDNPNVEIHPVLPTPKFIHNGIQGQSARNRYCVCIWRKRNETS